MYLNCIYDFQKRNKLGETPLIVAAKSGSAKAVRRLLHAGVDYCSQDKVNFRVFKGKFKCHVW